MLEVPKCGGVDCGRRGTLLSQGNDRGSKLRLSRDLDKSIGQLVRATEISGENNFCANNLAKLRKVRERFEKGSTRGKLAEFFCRGL